MQSDATAQGTRSISGGARVAVVRKVQGRIFASNLDTQGPDIWQVTAAGMTPSLSSLYHVDSRGGSLYQHTYTGHAGDDSFTFTVRISSELGINPEHVELHVLAADGTAV